MDVGHISEPFAGIYLTVRGNHGHLSAVSSNLEKAATAIALARGSYFVSNAPLYHGCKYQNEQSWTVRHNCSSRLIQLRTATEASIDTEEETWRDCQIWKLSDLRLMQWFSPQRKYRGGLSHCVQYLHNLMACSSKCKRSSWQQAQSGMYQISRIPFSYSFSAFVSHCSHWSAWDLILGLQHAIELHQPMQQQTWSAKGIFAVKCCLSGRGFAFFHLN